VAIVAGLYTRWLHRWALFLGWAAAMVYGTVAAYRQTVPNTKVHLVNGTPTPVTNGTRHFGSPLATFPFTHTKVYIAITALVINVVVAVVITVVLRLLHTPAGTDATEPDDYYSDAASKEVLATTEKEVAGVESPATG
jgi:SSS family solute:Na+ symporter